MATPSSPPAKAKKAAKAPAVKATAPRATKAKVPTKDAQPKVPARAAAPRKRRTPGVDPDQRRQYVAVAAYYIAERRGFQGDCAMDDWVQAEMEIDRLLAADTLRN